MFREFPCGCIVSEQQGRVRICESHRTESPDGRGAERRAILKGKIKYYPGNGEMVPGWAGR